MRGEQVVGDPGGYGETRFLKIPGDAGLAFAGKTVAENFKRLIKGGMIEKLVPQILDGLPGLGLGAPKEALGGLECLGVLGVVAGIEGAHEVELDSQGRQFLLEGIMQLLIGNSISVLQIRD